jgi:two-component system nitrogen regulation response regulator NtrX
MACDGRSNRGTVKRLLVVEDEDLLRASLTTLLTRHGYEVRAVRNGTEALGSAAEFAPDVLITDWLLKEDPHGLDVARELRRNNPELQVVVMSGLFSRDIRAKAECEPGVVAFMEKPFRFSSLADVLARVGASA